MSRAIPIAATLLLVVASVASAATGVNLTWGDRCWKDGGVTNLDWACATDAGTVGTLSVSFQVSAHHDDFLMTGIFLEGMSEAATLPDWWRLDPGSCRNGAFGLSTDFTALTTSCTDLWEGLGVGGIGQYLVEGSRVHIYTLWVADLPFAIEPDVEYACAMFPVSAAKTTGADGCGGCATPMVWGVYRLEVGYLDSPTEVVMEPLQNQCVTWQHSALGCNGTVPVRNVTWGRVKSLYR